MNNGLNTLQGLAPIRIPPQIRNLHDRDRLRKRRLLPPYRGTKLQTTLS